MLCGSSPIEASSGKTILGMATLRASETFKTASIRGGYNWSTDALGKDFR